MISGISFLKTGLKQQEVQYKGFLRLSEDNEGKVAPSSFSIKRGKGQNDSISKVIKGKVLLGVPQ
jgi:hypothetical protein